MIDLLTGNSDGRELDRAALELARIEYPALEPEPFLALLDSHAAELGGRVPRRAAGSAFVEQANEYLFEELGFRGNSENYYDPRNSCLNDVLTTRRGIPITLSVVYIEIARRLGRRVRGVGLPGHFLVRYDEQEFTVFIDPFHGVVLRDAEACFRLARQVTGVEFDPSPELLEPVTSRQVIARMMANLRAIYFRRRQHAKLLRLLDLLLEANPDSAEERKQRGMVHLQVRNMSAALADLERYLELAPEAADLAQIQKQVLEIRRYLARMN